MDEEKRRKLEAELEEAEGELRDVLAFINDDSNLTEEGIAAREVLRRDLEEIRRDMEAVRQEHGSERVSEVEDLLRRSAEGAEAEQLEREISGNLSPADEEMIDLREERQRREAFAPTLGSCPVCGSAGLYGNIYRTHFFYCDEHRLTWSPGSNIMSSWRDEDEAEWRATWERVKDYRTVDGFGQHAPGPPLREQTTFAELVE